MFKMRKNLDTGQLKNLGYVHNVFAGLQFDLNVIRMKALGGCAEGHFCDHNCDIKYGNYSCPAAFLKNFGTDKTSLMSLKEITKSLKIAKEGLEIMNRKFIEIYLPKWEQKFKIPKKMAVEVRSTLTNGNLELNLFGGNPELHPDFLRIIEEAQNQGWIVTTTTTGKKFMHDKEFIRGFVKHPPDLLALSADDYEDVEELREIVGMNLRRLKTYWQKVNPLYGQRKKAYESIYVAKLLRQHSLNCKILFNIVVHPGNLESIEEILGTLREKFPGAIVNPYPAQSSFLQGPAIWQLKHLKRLENFIDMMIAAQLNQKQNLQKNYVPRLHYWIALKSIFESIKDGTEQCQMLSGFRVWHCAKETGAGRYLQAGSSVKMGGKSDRVGAHPGCFWNNNSVTEVEKQLWNMQVADIARYTLEKKSQLLAEASNPCSGCIMPRLMFDGVSLELGLNKKLYNSYFGLREKYLGF